MAWKSSWEQPEFLSFEACPKVSSRYSLIRIPDNRKQAKIEFFLFFFTKFPY